MNNLSKLLFCLVSIISGILVSTQAMAAAANNVSRTKHNFAYNGGIDGGGNNVYQASKANVTQVCVFCHTPHNAGKNELLWNKANNAAINFRLYTSSSTLTSVASKATLPEGSPSLLCLSCHDGKTAMNILHNSKDGITAPGDYPAGSALIQTLNGGDNPLAMPAPVNIFGVKHDMRTGGASGDDLTNDHPIGFSYSDAYDEKVANGGGLHSIAQVGTNSANSIRFFGPKNRVECSTCHNPHVDTSPAGDPSLKPFLSMTNDASALCLSCHDK